LDPPQFFSGVPDFEEAGRAMTSPGGQYGTGDPAAKMTPLMPQISGEALGFAAQIDKAFADASGLPPTTEGEAPPSGRGLPQFMALAGIGASRVRKMAVKLEDALSRIATLGFQVMQRVDTTDYPLKDGGTFLLSQLPTGTSLSVIAHSGAPIFQEQTQQVAMALHKVGAIDGPWLVELLSPPFRSEIKQRAEELAAAKAEQSRELIQLQALRYSRRGGGLGK
jgi:hypothetical protein